MIILNTSFHFLASHEPDFINWATDRYINAAKQSGLFDETLLIKILTEIDPKVKAYAIQLRSVSRAEATAWHEEAAATLVNELSSRWGEEFVHFTTFMEIIGS